MSTFTICTFCHMLLGWSNRAEENVWVHVAYLVEMIFVYKIVLGKLQGEWSLGRPWCRWYNSIHIYLTGMVYECRTGSIWIIIGISGRLYDTVI
jgi:hypothetical protein